MIIVKSQKGVDQIIDNEKHIWEKVRTNRDCIRWRCIVKSCKAKSVSAINYTQNLASFEVTNIHDHLPDINLAIRKPIKKK